MVMGQLGVGEPGNLGYDDAPRASRTVIGELGCAGSCPLKLKVGQFLLLAAILAEKVRPGR